jgi:predicted site-specific integrase-resolvase
MVEDLMTIVHGFSARLYSLRNYKKTLTTALKAEQRAQN